MDARLKKFELMLTDIKCEYKEISLKLDKLKLENKTNTTTFKQLLTKKMQYKNILIIYKSYGLVENY